jgi:hypothetical protein
MTQEMALQTLVSAEQNAVAGLRARADRPGVQTSEFWAPVVAPVATFALTFLLGTLATHALIPGTLAEQLSPGVAATITSGLSSLAAREYVRVRTELKRLALMLGAGK